MSIASEITRLQTAKSDLATSIANKGVTVPASATLDDYAALVDSIQTGGGGGSTLPYDAEVEYLQSDGTAYINTGITPSLSNRVRCRFQFSRDASNTDSNGTIFGVLDGWKVNTFMFTYNTYSSSGYNSWGNKTTTISSSLITLDTWHILTFEYNHTLIDSFTSSLVSSPTGQPTKPMYVFCANYGGVSSTGIFGYGAEKKISWFRMYSSDTTMVLDLIPVRVGQVGYMYDRVSKTLFGNAGTGSFTLGNDVT